MPSRGCICGRSQANPFNGCRAAGSVHPVIVPRWASSPEVSGRLASQTSSWSSLYRYETRISWRSARVYYGRRRYERRSAFLLGMSPLGRIFIKNTFIKTCTLLDISHGGACLRVHFPNDIPETFELEVEALKTKKTCRIIWRNKDEIGIEFGSDVDPRRTESSRRD